MRTQTGNLVSKFGILAVCTVAALASGGCNSPTPGGTNTWSIQGVTGPTVSEVDNQILVSVVLQNVDIDGGGTVPIPDLDGSTIEVAPDITGGTLIQIGVSADALANLVGANTLPPQTLPGGRPLPGVTTGELPSIAVEVPKWDNVAFYFGPSVFGVFVPVKFQDDQITGTFDYYGGASNALMGQISVVGNDANNENSGFLLMLDLANILPQPSPTTSAAMN